MGHFFQSAVVYSDLMQRHGNIQGEEEIVGLLYGLLRYLRWSEFRGDAKYVGYGASTEG